MARTDLGEKMAVKVYIPTPFRSLTGGRARVEGQSETVAGLLGDLESRFPGLRERLRDDSGKLLQYVNVYVNSREIDELNGEGTALKDGDEVSIIPAVAGGDILTEEQVKRYSRHLLLGDVGPIGVRKLMNAKVLLIGAGGLGSPAMLYLAAAGVGTIGIVDFDVVDMSNLQRQVVHTSDRVGEKKVDSARRTIQALNPEVNVVGHDEMLVADNVDRLISGYDLVVDGTDTFETRYLLNDAAVEAGIPVVHASVFRFEGQLTVFKPFGGPCYRCLYPTPPPPELAPGCSVAGVLGVVPGIMGLLQANETIKVLLGIGDPLIGRLLLFDALDATFSELKLRRDPECPVCSDAAVEARRAGRPMPVAAMGADEPFTLGSRA